MAGSQSLEMKSCVGVSTRVVSTLAIVEARGLHVVQGMRIACALNMFQKIRDWQQGAITSLCGASVRQQPQLSNNPLN